MGMEHRCRQAALNTETWEGLKQEGALPSLENYGQGTQRALVRESMLIFSRLLYVLQKLIGKHGI